MCALKKNNEKRSVRQNMKYFGLKTFFDLGMHSMLPTADSITLQQNQIVSNYFWKSLQSTGEGVSFYKQG